MKNIGLASLLSVGLAAWLFLSGCTGATTTLTGSWMNEAYRGKPVTKVLVLGISKNETIRRIFEQGFADEIQSAGPRAIPGYQVLPDIGDLGQQEILERVKGQGFDTIVITKLLQRETQKQRITDIEREGFPDYYHPYYDYRGDPYWYGRPHYHPNWYSDYRSSYDTIRKTEYTVNYNIYTLETNVYDAASESPIWSAITETTFVEGNRENLVESFTQQVVDKMIEDGLL